MSHVRDLVTSAVDDLMMIRARHGPLARLGSAYNFISFTDYLTWVANVVIVYLRLPEGTGGARQYQ